MVRLHSQKAHQAGPLNLRIELDELQNKALKNRLLGSRNSPPAAPPEPWILKVIALTPLAGLYESPPALNTVAALEDTIADDVFGTR